MNSEQLRNFALAYRTHNFAAAARAIPMTAQGFTKSIRTLESELGVSLFVHNKETGSQVPTPYADELMAYQNDVEERIRLMNKAFRRIEAEESGRVLLGSTLGIMGLLGGKFVAEFEAANPGVTLSYTELNDQLVEEQLADETTGLAFTLAPYNPAFDTVDLYTTPVCIWVHHEDALAERELLSIADLKGRDLALPGPGYKCYSSILARCKNVGFEPRITLASSEMFWLYQFARDRRGLAFSAGHLGDLPFFDDGTVKCIPLADLEWRFGISSLPKHKFTEAERAFRKFTLDYCARNLSPPR